MNYFVIACAMLFLVGWVCFLVIQGVLKAFSAVSQTVNEQREAFASRKARRIAQAEFLRAEAFRAANPVRIAGIPNVDAFVRAFATLDEYTHAADAYRPTLPTVTNTRFRNMRFPSLAFELIRPHPASLSDVKPQRISLTSSDVLMASGANMSSLYEAIPSCEFPSGPPHLRYPETESNTGKPNFPTVASPPEIFARLLAADGSDVDHHDKLQAKAYESELQRVALLNSQARELLLTFRQKYTAAIEARDLMDIYISGLALEGRNTQALLPEEFEQRKKSYEEECQRVTLPIRVVYERYLQRTPEGVRSHFELALCYLTLPIPEDYPWEVLYDQEQRILQVNQCVPSLPDISVIKPDSKRPPAKRDVEATLRRYVPAVSLQIAYHLAKNDLQNDVDRIAINCWSRFFDPASGKLKDAFVSALAIQKQDIVEFDLQHADALEAFRALKGAYLYSASEVVPIEPAIRLDKEDERFVVGRDILDGMVQGENLAAMDWQDFEHLIRELLAKEYADKNADVRITRASRDRGVDAVIFNSDPLHGGKIVVQAKRYSNAVDVAAVRELYGTVLNEGADRGILVTTSHFGRDAYEWAANKQLTLIDGHNLLALLSKHGYRFKIETQSV